MKRLFRSDSDRMVAGICGGLGQFLTLDPTILRLLFLVGLFFSGFTLGLVYIVAIFIIPNEWEVR